MTAANTGVVLPGAVVVYPCVSCSSVASWSRDATQGDHWMSIDELLHLSTLLLPAVVMWWLHLHLREIERATSSGLCAGTPTF